MRPSLIASETVVYKGNPNLTFRTSLGLNIELSEAFNILVFGDYGYANEKLEADLGSSEMDQTNQVISYINTGIGLSYKFK